MSTALTAERLRSDALDRLRGAAIAAMVVDHLCLVFDGPVVLRWTIGRLALPVFFVLAGHLARRVTGRYLAIAGTGAALPLLVPWLNTPNVLLVYAAGAAVLVASTRLGAAGPAVVGIAAVTAAANGLGTISGAYPPLLLLALMAAGHYLPRGWLERPGHLLPAVLAPVGRRPLTWYVGHVLALHVVGVLTTT